MENYLILKLEQFPKPPFTLYLEMMSFDLSFSEKPTSRYYFPFLYSLNFFKTNVSNFTSSPAPGKVLFQTYRLSFNSLFISLFTVSEKWGEIVSPLRPPLVYSLFILIIMAIEFPGFKSPPDVKRVKIFKLQTVLFARWEEKPYKKCFQKKHWHLLGRMLCKFPNRKANFPFRQVWISFD